SVFLKNNKNSLLSRVIILFVAEQFHQYHLRHRSARALNFLAFITGIERKKPFITYFSFYICSNSTSIQTGIYRG
ncbi:hypothetical protein P3495_24000, partial [Vibrio parahaemolyticus]|nr:hypothetical protein [Vibrio parahaemolyticus]